MDFTLFVFISCQTHTHNTHTHTHIYIYTHAHTTHIHTPIYIHTHTHIHTCIYINTHHTHTHTHIYICIYTLTTHNTHIHTHTHTHTHTHIYIYIYICIYILYWQIWIFSLCWPKSFLNSILTLPLFSVLARIPWQFHFPITVSDLPRSRFRFLGYHLTNEWDQMISVNFPTCPTQTNFCFRYFVITSFTPSAPVWLGFGCIHALKVPAWIFLSHSVLFAVTVLLSSCYPMFSFCV